ncbi:AarF/UbiB family protein [Polyangium sorediatum]|uniref:AarF/UbiB family protein n=2 Tax=Polyangium sorediatum TaxID=889274 RepID=A0ABT6NYH2_9BACT|nr:AarF/UbiB family protein [Polyangium sorediatum]
MRMKGDQALEPGNSRGPESGPRPTAVSHLRLVKGDENKLPRRRSVSGAVPRTRRALPDQIARERDIERLVSRSLKGYKEKVDLFSSFAEGADAGVLRPIPRRKVSRIEPGPPPEIPQPKAEKFEASTWATVLRCFVWLNISFVLLLGILMAKLRGKDTVESRAKRTLAIVRRLGGTAIKIGQQLSMRVDMLPYEYCREFSKLLDNVKPFPTKTAIQIIEQATKKPLDETFLIFDPKPIGSASIACVYQAVLRDGRKVAIKVRRPGIGRVFATDLKAMRWIINALESLSIIRPGYLQNFIKEFEETIMEELDFKMEAYHQSVFMREARKFKIKGKQICSAPEAIYELSNNEVMVEEFVDGMWMWEILAAVENKDPVALQRMRELFIDPKTLAERLMFVQMWSQYVSVIFHADPHPANIIVQENGKIVFVDFGACGSMDRIKKEAAMDQLYYFHRKDVAGFVQAMIAFMEPLPPIDMAQFTKELEIKIGQNLQKLWSKRAEWHEKSTAPNWFALFNLTKQFNIPLNMDTVRALRANMLYDTLALRIYPELDTFRVSKKFLEHFDENSKSAAGVALRKRLSRGLISGSDIRTINDLFNILSRGMRTMRRLVDRPIFSFSYMLEKSVFTVMEIIRLVVLLSFALFTALGGVLVYRKLHGMDLELMATLMQVAKHKAFLAVAGLISLITVRRIMLRLGDMEVE